MPFVFVCPFCHAKFNVDDAYRGQAGQCAECGKPIAMPGIAKASQSAVEVQSSSPPKIAKNRKLLYRGGLFLGGLMGLSLIVFVLYRLALPELTIVKARHDTNLTAINLQRIANALNEYAKDYGSYPPPEVADKNGVPLYSWRVLILPYLGYENIYNSFDLNASWSNQQNIVMLGSMPDEYKSIPNDYMLGNSETLVTFVVGQNTLFPTATSSLSSADISDSTDETILVTEGRRKNNTWTAPFDLTMSGLLTVTSSATDMIGGTRSVGAIAITVDESRLYLPEALSNTKVLALVSPSGGENINIGEFDSDRLEADLRDIQ